MRDAVRAHRKMMYLGIVAGLLWAVARVAVPSLAGAAVDHGVAKDDWSSARNWMFLILAVGVVQAIVHRAAALRRVRARAGASRPTCACGSSRTCSACTSRSTTSAQTGQLMAHANTDIQQINNVVLLIPLTIASVDQMVAVAVILRAAESRARVVRARRAAAAQHRGDAVQPHACTRSAWRCRRSSPDLSGVVEESVAGVRVVKGFGVGAAAASAARRPRPTSVYDRSIDQARLRAGLPAAHRLPPDARPRRHPLVRRPPGDRRATSRSATSSRPTSTC